MFVEFVGYGGTKRFILLDEIVSVGGSPADLTRTAIYLRGGPFPLFDVKGTPEQAMKKIRAAEESLLKQQRDRRLRALDEVEE